MHRLLYIEPFNAGSHAQFGNALHKVLSDRFETHRLEMRGRHWKWRMRGSAAFLVHHQREVLSARWDVLFASSYLPLAELYGLVPSLAAVPSVLFFHENQYAYPNRQAVQSSRDLHYGFTQLVSALAATRAVFNSAFNRDSFFEEANSVLKRMPDAVSPEWIPSIERKSCVLPLPLDLPDVPPATARDERSAGPLILWNHRWEHDKGPDDLLWIADQLAARSAPFRLAVAGEAFAAVPAAFTQLEQRHGARLECFGRVEGREDYRRLMARSDVVLSTARHEFFGVSVLEAAHFGARPLVPDRLAYPELIPAEHRYSDRAEAVERLAAWCAEWRTGKVLRGDFRSLTEPMRSVGPRYVELLEDVSQTTRNVP